MIQGKLAKLGWAILGSVLSITVSLANDDDVITLQADNIRYDYKKGVVYYTGAVNATQGVTHLSATQMVVYYNQKHKIKEIVANGNLAKYQTLIHDNKDTFSAQANSILYYPITGTVLLKDQASVTYNKNFISGPYISYDMKQQRITSHPKKNSRATIILEPIKNLLDPKKA